MMLCSNCSKPVVPVVAIDIDGTLGDYHSHFLEFASRYLGHHGTLKNSYGGAGSFKEWFCRVYLDNESGAERTWNDIKLAYRQGGMKRSMPKYPWASGLCSHLRECNIELWLTTTRPYLRLDNVDPDTRFWLELHSISFDGLLYDEHKYAKLAEYVDRERVIAIVDDLPEQIEAARQAFHWKTPIFRRTQYNSDIAGEGHWKLESIENEIMDRLATWRKEHGNASIYPNA